ncbi:sensor histidine kinase [Ottowia sp.]|uniref:sensor histidine kinase n=1 Tax=Ottowia sp. TaxID=1898956 RepID=UPI00396482B3
MDVAHAAPRGQGLELRIRPARLGGQRSVLLERILGNLVANAVRYTRSGAMLWAAGARGRAAHRRVDTGIGIAPDKQERIFDEFYRLDAEGGAADGGCWLHRRAAGRLLGHQVSVRSVPDGFASRSRCPKPPASRTSHGCERLRHRCSAGCWSSTTTRRCWRARRGCSKAGVLRAGCARRRITCMARSICCWGHAPGPRR